MFKRVSWPLGLLLLLSAAAHAGDFRIVPGRRIGTVVLGMNRAAVHTRLHTPVTSRRYGGLTLDTWFGSAPLPPSMTRPYVFKRDYVCVFFRHGRAVQIEATSPDFTTATGLSTRNSPNRFQRDYPHASSPRFPGNAFRRMEYDLGGGGMPAPKHFVFYDDSVQQGLAWKYAAWGAAAPEPDMDRPLEALVVHVPGQVVLLNPNDGLPHAGTGPARE